MHRHGRDNTYVWKCFDKFEKEAPERMDQNNSTE